MKFTLSTVVMVSLSLVAIFIVFSHLSHVSVSTLSSVLARIVTCNCFLSSAIPVFVWFLAILCSSTRSRHLSFGMALFRFPSTVIYLHCLRSGKPLTKNDRQGESQGMDAIDGMSSDVDELIRELSERKAENDALRTKVSASNQCMLPCT